MRSIFTSMPLNPTNDDFWVVYSSGCELFSSTYISYKASAMVTLNSCPLKIGKVRFSPLRVCSYLNFICTSQTFFEFYIHWVLHRNYFTTLPLDMGDTKNLKVLNLKHNRFVELPRILYTFTKIQVIGLHFRFKLNSTYISATLNRTQF